MKYQKRIHWDRHRPEFLKIGFIFALAICFMAFNYTSEPPVFQPFEIGELDDETMITPPITLRKKDTPPPAPPPDIKKVVNIEPTSEPTIRFEPKIEFSKEVETVEDEYANDPVPEPAPKVEIIKPVEPKETPPLVLAERMPIYGSCDVDSEENERRDCTNQNLIKHIYENVKYPGPARDYEVQGTVVVSFIVNKKGQVENIEILRDIGMGCGDEVKRVINKLGQFLPGKQNGRPVSVIYRLPVKFSLQ